MPTTIPVHGLPEQVFLLLASGRADAEAMALLHAGQLSRHALLLREVVLEARARHPGAATEAGLAAAAEALEDVQRRRPTAAAAVLSYPLVGAWAAHCLRRLRSSALAEEPDAPLWVELAHLGGVAAAAAVHAGLDVDLTLPLRTGRVAVPTVGVALLSGDQRWGKARLHGGVHGYRITTSSGSVALPGAYPLLSQQPAEASWLPLRRFRIGTPEAELNLVVDDLDPYRDLHGLGSSDRLDDAAAQRWNVLAQEAWRHIVARHSHRIPELAGSPLVVIPLRPVEDGLEVNGTARESVGAIAMSPPVDALDLAQSLIHEIQHSKLGALLDLIDLYDTTDQQLHYSPWRLDSRPVGGLLQGVYAFSAVADFWSSYADSDDEQVASVALNHVAMLRRQLAEAVDILQSSGALTTIGDRFCDVLQTTNTKLDRVAVPRQVQGQVDTAFANHRATWQFDHLRIGSSRSSEHDPQ